MDRDFFNHLAKNYRFDSTGKPVAMRTESEIFGRVVWYALSDALSVELPADETVIYPSDLGDNRRKSAPRKASWWMSGVVFAAFWKDASLPLGAIS